MRRHRPAILALAVAVLAVLPLAHGAAAAAQPSPGGDQRVAVDAVSGVPFVEDQANTTNYLVMEDDRAEREEFGTVDLDVGTAVATGVERMEQGYGALTFEKRFRNASAERRQELLRDEADRIETRIDALGQRQESAIAAFNREDITARQLLTRLSTIDAAARELDSRRTLVEETARESASPRSFLIRLANVESELAALRGPIRERIGAAAGSASPAQTLYVVTSSDGIVLASTDDRRFHREAYLGDSREPGGPDRFAQGPDPGTVNASDRAAELYPWLYNQILPSTRQFGNTSVYYVSAETRTGIRFDAYLDGATRDVFREVQSKRVASMPTYTVANRSDTLRIRANHTHGTGPMEVAVTDPDTGEPVNASVTVNGHTVGSTGDDGRIRTITPYDAVRIRATTADGDTIWLPFFAR